MNFFLYRLMPSAIFVFLLSLVSFAESIDSVKETPLSIETKKDLYSINEGDRVYFCVTAFSFEEDCNGMKKSDATKISFYQDKKKLKECAKIKPGDEQSIPDNKKIELLLEKGNSSEYTFSMEQSLWVHKNPTLTSEFTTWEVFSKLQESMNNFPNDPREWEVVLTSNNTSVTLQFMGIQRIYEVTQIMIPLEHAPRSGDDDSVSKDPTLGIYIFCDTTKEEFEQQASTSGWLANFSPTEKNQFEIREGSIRGGCKDVVDTTYKIKIFNIAKSSDRGAFLSTVKNAFPALEFANNVFFEMSNIKDTDFRKGYLIEDNLSDDDGNYNKNYHVRIEFQLLKK